jgi:hypothetical protein
MQLRSSKLFLLPVFILLAALGSALPVAAETSFELDYVNRYIWRGFDLNADNNFAIQPSIDFSFAESRWSVNLWQSFSAEDKDLNEVDITLNYDFPASENLSVSAGIVHYGWYWVDDFNSERDTTIETYVVFSWFNAYLTPELSFYHDCMNGNGLYAQLALAKEFVISENQKVELSSTIGYNHKQWISQAGLSDITAMVSIPVANNGKIGITPYAAITWPLLDEINPGVSREYWLGVNFAF